LIKPTLKKTKEEKSWHRLFVSYTPLSAGAVWGTASKIETKKKDTAAATYGQVDFGTRAGREAPSLLEKKTRAKKQQGDGMGSRRGHVPKGTSHKGEGRRCLVLLSAEHNQLMERLTRERISKRAG